MSSSASVHKVSSKTKSKHTSSSAEAAAHSPSKQKKKEHAKRKASALLNKEEGDNDEDDDSSKEDIDSDDEEEEKKEKLKQAEHKKKKKKAHAELRLHVSTPAAAAAAIEPMADKHEEEGEEEHDDDDGEQEMLMDKFLADDKEEEKKQDIVKAEDKPAATAAGLSRIEQLRAELAAEEKKAGGQALVPFKKEEKEVKEDTTVAAAAAAPKKEEEMRIIVGGLLPTSATDGGNQFIVLPPVTSIIIRAQNLLADVRRNAYRESNPDHCVLLESMAKHRMISVFEIANPVLQIFISKSSDKKSVFNPVTRETKKFSKPPFVNISTKFKQSFDTNGNLFGYHLVTPFFQPAYVCKWGPTIGTGVEGDVGQEINGSIKQEDAASYNFTMSNQAYSPMLQDENYNNPIMNAFFAKLETMCHEILVKAFANATMLPEVRNVMKQRWTANGQSDESFPTKPRDLADLCKRFALCKMRFAIDKTGSDPSRKYLSVSAKVYRTLAKAREEDGGALEEVTDDMRPTEMFRRNIVNKQCGLQQVHRRIPMRRYRRADEIKQGESYDSQFVHIPWQNAAVNSSDFINLLLKLGFYEWKRDMCGFKLEVTGVNWLNKMDAIASLFQTHVAPVNPLFGCPMAGHYAGPADKAAEHARDLQNHIELAAKEAEISKARKEAMECADSFSDDPEHSQFGSNTPAAAAVGK